MSLRSKSVVRVLLSATAKVIAESTRSALRIIVQKSELNSIGCLCYDEQSVKRTENLNYQLFYTLEILRGIEIKCSGNWEEKQEK